MPAAVIVDAVRSPMGRGKAGGALSGLHPVDLLAQVLQALAGRSDLDPAMVDDVLVGCVGQNGEQSATPGRQTSRASTSCAGRAAARAAVASPTPEPISTTSGASRPKYVVNENPGWSTASSGITQRAECASHAAVWLGVNRLPRRE